MQCLTWATGLRGDPMDAPVDAFHILMLLSSEPLAILVPSLLKSKHVTSHECPVTVDSYSPVFAFQILRHLSTQQLAICELSDVAGLKPGPPSDGGACYF
jgi:hypothetical protein